jgi:hypothetical protein
MALRLEPPATDSGAARLHAAKSPENWAFRYRETTYFDCHRAGRTSSGGELHPR